MMIDLGKPAVLWALLAAAQLAAVADTAEAGAPRIADDEGFLPSDLPKPRLPARGEAMDLTNGTNSRPSRPLPDALPQEDGGTGDADSGGESSEAEALDGSVAHNAAEEMQFQTMTAEQLVAALIMNDELIEIRVGDQSSSHIDRCAAYFSNGHALGNLWEKSETTGGPVRDANGNLIDTGVPVLPDTGVILSSGNPRDFNHNDRDDQTTDYDEDGDGDLKKSVDLSNGWDNAVYDACVLEFEFRCPQQTVAYIPEVQFKYVWGSEEYYEYVHSQFNDVFGFYLNDKNIARLPTTDTNSDIVSINNVNYKNNFKYFHGNDPGTGWEEDPGDVPYDLAVIYPQIEADGFTDTLTAWGEPESDPLTWNRIKLAVGDVGDGILDSWVLLEGASFACHDVTEAPSQSQAPSGAPSEAPTVSQAPTPNPTLSPTLSTAPTEAPSLRPTTSTAPTGSPSASPTVSAEPTGSPSASPTVSSRPTGSPSESPTVSSKPTASPSDAPTVSTKPSASPSASPTVSSRPTGSPSASPTLSSEPTASPSDTPTVSTEPTSSPSTSPTASSRPTGSPSDSPTVSSKPTGSPSASPTVSSEPTALPSASPTISSRPTGSPSASPTVSSKPTGSPSDAPTISTEPTASPSDSPSTSSRPTLTGSMYPSSSKSPSAEPTETHSQAPSNSPSASPTKSVSPTAAPSDAPTLSTAPSDSPSASPTVSTAPTDKPSESPTVSTSPTASPSMSPTESSAPSLRASDAPSTSSMPSDSPSASPTVSSKPTDAPSLEPTLSTAPSSAPTSRGSIGPNTVFNDTDADGVQDEGEGPLDGVTIHLHCIDENGDTHHVDTVVTDAEGQYEFDEIAPSTCYIEVEVEPQDYVFSPVDPNGNQIYPNGTSPVAEVNYNENVEGWDVGMHPPLSQIGPSVVFNDLDEDGVQDEGEGLLAGVTVGLVCDGTEVDTTTTDAEGAYEFLDVLPGQCFVFVTPEVEGNGNYVFSPIVEGGDSQIFANGTSPIVAIGFNETVDAWNAGMYLPLSEVGPNVVFNDLDQDGVQDEGEGPLEGVEVALVCDSTEVDSTTTDAEGLYEFADVQPGECYVSVTPEVEGNNNYVFSPVVNDGNQIYPNGTSPVTAIGYNETVDTWSVGMYLPLSQVGPNVVFNDLDEDGVQDEGEGPLEGVAVSLVCDGTEVDNTATNSEGVYEFSDVQPGECYVSVTPELDGNDEYVFSPVVEGGDSQIYPNGTSPTVAIGYNQTVDTWDVGMYLPLSSVGPNVVFNDLDQDGVQDEGEGPLEGVEVALVCDGTEVDSTATDAEGVYEFSDVQPGECYVSVTPELDGNNYVFSPVENGGNQIHPNGTSPTVSVGYNDTLDTWNVGMYLPLSQIGPSAVFNDVNQDGILDEGEEPLVGVPISLVCDGQTVNVTTSNSDGVYEFTGVQPGECHVEVTPQPDYNFSPIVDAGNQINATGISPTVTIGYNETVDEWHVGMFLPPATVGPNEVFDDLDGDGQRDPLEPPMVNQTIDLYCYDDDGVAQLIATNTTNDQGQYWFHDVNPGACYIYVDPPDDYVPSPQQEGGNSVGPNGTSPTREVDWDDTIDDWDVGMYQPVTLGNKVWEDRNANGIQEDDEPGLPGITVTLVNGTGDDVAEMETAADGSYWFTDLPPGEYSVRFELPVDYEFAPPPPPLMMDPDLFGGTLPDMASDVTPVDETIELGNNVGVTPSQTLASGATSSYFDAGIYVNITVEGIAWDDLNADGVMDAGEPPLSGVGIMVSRIEDGLEMYVDYLVTAEDGSYSLQTRPGTYVGLVTAPSSDYQLSPKVEGGSNFDPLSLKSDQVLLASGDTGAGSFNAGFHTPGSVSSYVWSDDNGNGLQDEGEGPYTEGMVINLYSADDPNAVIASTSADPSDGSFSFDTVAPGEYEVEFVPVVTGATFTDPNVGEDDTVDSDVDPTTGRAPMTVTSGATVDDIAAGVTSLPNIGPNSVFQDDNANGIQDEGEPGLPEVTVILYDSENNQVEVVTTDENGEYSFQSLQPGAYYISVNNDPSYLFSPVTEGGNQISPDSDAPEYGNSSPVVTLQSGDNDNTLQVGMYEPVSVGDMAWNDMNGNGILDETEPGMEGVMVTLLLNGETEDIQVTDQDGLYSFNNLVPGAYSVKFDLPDPEYIFTIHANDTTGTTSHVDRDTGITTAKSLTSGEENNSFDAGMFLPVTINGTAWHDLNADGVEEDGEPPLSGVTVTLFNAEGDNVGSQVTGADGVWEFDELPPGTYEALITPPDHDPEYMLSPSPADESETSRTADFDYETWRTAPVTLLGGENGDGSFDAGLYVPATIGDYIWFDSNPNGLQEFEEQPYNETVTVKLIDDLGYTVQETESDVTTGSYEFTGVRPGAYDVHFILTNDDYGFTIPHAGNDTAIDSDVSPTTGKASVVVTSGQVELDIDAGIMDFGPYYPDWTNDVQVCTNDGFDPSWLEIQEENYLYSNKEDCCLTHFWWRMTQCMANEQFKFYKNGDICDTKIFFEDWETNSPADWTRTTQFDTVEECCANMFWFDFDGCIGRSPVMFKFDFCVDIKGLVDPPDCQTADIFANVIGDAVNEGCHHTHGLEGTNFTSHNDDHRRSLAAQRSLDEGHITTAANISKLGGVSLTEDDGTTVCGGDLAGEGFTNELTGTTVDIAAAADNVATVCGTVTVEEEECTSEACLNEHYNDIVQELEEFVNNGEFTEAIRSRAETRLPSVPELMPVEALAHTLTTQNLVLPATITGDLDWKFFHGSDLTTCMQKVVFQPNETPYDNLVDCCTTHFQWDVEGCCSKGGGCPEMGIAADVAPDEDAEGVVEYYFPTWVEGKLCDKKAQFEDWENEKYNTLAECCDAKFPGFDNNDCLNPTG